MSAASLATEHGSTEHIRKRSFQPSITSYFRSSSYDGSASRTTRAMSPLLPALPAETQASLLSVGMRVRKSVPEGYKTHKTLGNAVFPFPNTAPAQSTYLGAPHLMRSQIPRELTPFCGLHKIGGWAVQEAPPSSAPAVILATSDEEDESELPGLAWSQSTISSPQVNFVRPASKKRTYEEEREEEIDAYFDEIDAEESVEQTLPRNDRPIARMKQPSDTVEKATHKGIVRIFGEDDIEDAAFLAPMDVDEL